MKRLTVLFVCCAFLVMGCNRHADQNSDKPSSQQQSDSSADIVDMTIIAQKHVGLVVAPAELRQLNQYLKVTGTVQPIDSKVAQVSPLAQGRILEVRVKVGDRVEAGQTLATFDNIEAGELVAQEQSARADLERMKAQLIPAIRQAGRSRRLADIGAGSEKDYESSKAEENGIEADIRSQQALIEGIQQRLRRFGVPDSGIRGALITTLKAPFAGVVLKAQASPGDVVDAGRAVFTVANLSHVWVQAEVYEKDLGRIRVGQTAYITVDAYPERPFEGRVAYIGDVIDPQTRTARVRCDVANPESRLKVDMFANVEVPTDFRKTAIAIPSSALQEVDGKTVVFIRRGPTQFEKREVEKGATVGDLTEIISGLSVGEPVVTQGAFHLKSILAVGSTGDND
ncbi:MAG: efflux RND transporter periplasmic adaptor subunit [Acidobacteriota bacterium]